MPFFEVRRQVIQRTVIQADHSAEVVANYQDVPDEEWETVRQIEGSVAIEPLAFGGTDAR